MKPLKIKKTPDKMFTHCLPEPVLHVPRGREQPHERHLAAEDGPVRPRGLSLRAVDDALPLHDIPPDRHQHHGDLLPVSLSYRLTMVFAYLGLVDYNLVIPLSA